MANKTRSYPSDVSDEEWAFCAPYLTLAEGQKSEVSRRRREDTSQKFVLTRHGESPSPIDLARDNRKHAQQEVEP
jgi:hypothetical protein